MKTTRSPDPSEKSVGNLIKTRIKDMKTEIVQSVNPVTTTGATKKNFDSGEASKTRLPDLVNVAIEAHGGLSRWCQIKSIDLKLSIGSGLWQLKGLPWLRDVSLHIDPKTPSVTTTPFTGDGRRGHFLPNRVWIDDDAGRLIQERKDPRKSFEGHSLTTPWDKLHELYFVSYALWNYFVTPFVFREPGLVTKEIEPYEEMGETWRRLHVTYPDNMPTHCKEQVFFFNEKGVLQRLDYAADVVGAPGAPGAHYCFDHQNFDGLLVPTLRRVVSRVGSKPKPSGPTLVLVQIGDVVIA
jgi:hypothetical protein